MYGCTWVCVGEKKEKRKGVKPSLFFHLASIYNFILFTLYNKLIVVKVMSNNNNVSSSYEKEFKKNSLEKRVEMYTQINKKYPNRFGIIVSKRELSRAPDITKNKYLAPDDITINQLVYVFRKRIKIKETQGVYFYVDNILLSVSSNTNIGEIYHRYKDEDGFLYITYDVENTFG